MNRFNLKGLLHEAKGEFPMAEVLYRSALHVMPQHGLALERLGRLYLRFRETIPAAVQCFFKAVEISPSNCIAWYLLGRCYSATGQHADAREAYNRSINLNPNDAQVWCSLGILYYSTGQYREALGMLSRSVKLDPSLGYVWHNIGALYEMCGQTDDARLAYEQANKLGHLQVAAGSLPPLTELVDSRIGASSNSAGGK
jgi:tetratricopeptide (TPR) repeat protein